MRPDPFPTEYRLVFTWANGTWWCDCSKFGYAETQDTIDDAIMDAERRHVDDAAEVIRVFLYKDGVAPVDVTHSALTEAAHHFYRLDGLWQDVPSCIIDYCAEAKEAADIAYQQQCNAEDRG
jgi:hypothetical protein